MKVNQIAPLLNEMYPEIVGESEPIKEDLSNLVSVGYNITSSSTFGDTLNQALQTVYDKVGQTLYDDKDYRGTAPDIYATDAVYGSVLEKIRVTANDFSENKAWTFKEGDSTSFEEMYGYHPAEVSAKYFNSMNTFKLDPYTITEKQFRSAFTSPDEMYRFIAHVELRMRTKMRVINDALIKRTINGLITEKFKTNNGVVNLLEIFHNEGGSSEVTASNALNGDANSVSFLRNAGKTVKLYRDLLKEETMLFNDDSYVTHTYDDTLKFIMLSDFNRALDTYLYSGTFNPEYLMVSGFDTVGYWQSIGETASYNDRSRIYAIPPSEGDAPSTGTDNRLVINRNGIVAVMFDKMGCMINARKPRTVVKPNETDEWYNVFHKWEAGQYIDTGENAIVFIISDYSYVPEISVSQPLDWATSYTNYYTYDPESDTYTPATTTWSANNRYYKKV